MGKLIDITGQKFNKLTVLEKTAAKSKASAYWACLCECGNTTVVAGCKLKSGSTKSCGCHRKSLNNNRTHGMANKTTTYRSWKEMRQRCLNPNSDKWRWYAGAGVTICEDWGDYAVFLSDMGERPKGKTLDRINPFGNYEPTNCRWATAKEQAQNKRSNYKMEKE